MKVKCIKRYSDIRLKEIIEVGTVLEVDKERAEHLIHDGVAEAAVSYTHLTLPTT